MGSIEKIISASSKAFPNSKIQDFHPYWEEVFEYAQINTEVRVAMFFGQAGIETGGFKVFKEGLNYSAQGLSETWPGRYAINPKADQKTPNALAKSLHRQPERIANVTYANRNGNRDEASGDGYRFKGRGVIQLTGAKNYVLFNNDMGSYLNDNFIKNPDALLQPRIGLYAAGWFWKTNNINPYADIKNIKAVTKKVQGGSLKLKERGLLFEKVLQLLTR